jgi:protein O-GlcNAc transferase
MRNRDPVEWFDSYEVSCYWGAQQNVVLELGNALPCWFGSHVLHDYSRPLYEMGHELKMLHDYPFRRYRLAYSLVILLFVLLTLHGLQSFRQPRGDILHGIFPTNHTLSHPSNHPEPSIPSDYAEPPVDSAWCSGHFGLEYLQSLSNSSTSYCTTNSGSSLTCFRSQTCDDGRVDAFCVGGPASFDVNEKKFGLNCELREWTPEDAATGIQDISGFHPYWYETGPFYIFDKHVQVDPTARIPSSDGTGPRKFSILIKREGTVYHTWHALMEIAATFMTIDVLRMTPDSATGRPMFSIEDAENTQVVILDDHPEGPYFDLWSLFAHRPILRLSEIAANTTLDSENIIIPLPGGANPMWQGDWKEHNCQHSALWHTFSRRVLNFYKVNSQSEGESAPLVLTFVDRKQQRRLIDKELYIEKLRYMFPDIRVQSVDFASLPFAEQLAVARGTDILVGVHGAGLTHGMFMRPGSTIVEIIPQGLEFKGFRNMAKLFNHHYFSSHALKIEGGTGNWQQDDIILEQDRFVGLLEVAVKSMYNRGLLNNDITK